MRRAPRLVLLAALIGLAAVFDLPAKLGGLISPPAVMTEGESLDLLEKQIKLLRDKMPTIPTEETYKAVLEEVAAGYPDASEDRAVRALIANYRGARRSGGPMLPALIDGPPDPKVKIAHDRLIHWSIAHDDPTTRKACDNAARAIEKRYVLGMHQLLEHCHRRRFPAPDEGYMPPSKSITSLAQRWRAVATRKDDRP